MPKIEIARRKNYKRFRFYFAYLDLVLKSRQ